MKEVSLDNLANELAKPGFERELIPLLMYRGGADIGRMHRMWNLTVAMMMHEAESIGEGINHLQMNPEWSQLCFPERRVQHSSATGFFSRLRMNPQVTDLVPGLTEYVEWLHPNFFRYDRVPLDATRSRKAWWRSYVPKVPEPRVALPVPDDFYEVANGKTIEWVMLHYARSRPVVARWFLESEAERAEPERRQELAYPFLLHRAKRPEHELLRAVNAAIPAHLPAHIRADMCQDLAVGILTGDFNADDLYLPAKEVAKRVHRMFPTKYGPLSLDAPVGDTDFTLMDTLIDEGRDWA